MFVSTMLPADGDWRRVPAFARRAEQAGFDALASAEIAHDPFVPLAVAALHTERIQLGTAIAVAFPRSPMVVAHTAWDLQAQSGGRFVLGLGSQVKGHNERRFSVAWSAPAPRLREYVESLRAIWRCWEHGEALDYRGRHYRFDLMTPEFSPKPTGLAPVPITLAAVGPAMLRLAGRVADGVRLHGFATRKYLEEVALPALEEGRTRTGRERRHFEIWGGGFIATGPDDAAVAAQLEEIRYRVAFYGSTRSYRGVLSVHGWDDLGDALHRLSKQGRWDEMAAAVPDEVVHAFAAVGRWDELPARIAERFGGLVDHVTLSLPGSADPERVQELVAALRRIPAPFVGHGRT